MPLNRLGDYLSQQIWNQNVEALEAAAAENIGRGILSGCELSAGTGLNVIVGTGVLHGGGSAVKINPSMSYLMPASGTYSLWFNCSTKALTHVSGSADPGEPLVCLGRVTTDSSSITLITAEGKVAVMRFENGGYSVNDGKLFLGGDGSFVATGEVSAEKGLQVDGGILNINKRVSLPVNIQTISSTLALDSEAPNIQVLTPTGADRKVLLPNISDWGTEYKFHNASATYSLIVRDHADTTTIGTIAKETSKIITPTVTAGGGSTPSFAVAEEAAPETTPEEPEA